MDSARWEKVQALFHEVADLAPESQRAFLEAACGDDRELVEQVLALADEDRRGGSLLDKDVGQVAEQVLESSAGGAGGVSGRWARERFGPYRLVRALGEGGMGVVYLAERADLGSVAAIKILRDAGLSPARRERFASEQRTLAQLHHPSIAQLYDADTLEDGTPWFAMEYVEGVPLTEYCRQTKAPLEERLRLFRLVCEAVQYAHRHAILHRDLKPSNILVTAEGRVKLLDFGIAKHLAEAEAEMEQTRTGLRLMTPAYAAPEQIRGGGVGLHTDVYALGVMLYELLTGRLPFDLSRKTPGEAEAMVAGQEAERPSAAARRAREKGEEAGVAGGKAVWADLDVLCLTAMHKDAGRRYRSAEALLRDVDHYRRGEPLEARPDSAGYRLGKFVGRNRQAVAATAAAGVLMVAVGAFFTWNLALARNEAVAEAARTQRILRFTQSLFQGGDAATGPAADLRVIALLERGEQEAQSLAGEPALQAELYHTLGGIHQQLSSFAKAEALLERALEQRRRLYGAEHAEVAESLVALGLLRADQARYEEAEELARQGLTMARRHLPENHLSIARATAAVGHALQQRGAYTEALPLLEEAVRRFEEGGGAGIDLANSLHELANTHFYAGNYDESERLNQRVLAIHARLYGERHPRVADDLINLGAIQFERGRYEEAERLYRQGLEVIEDWYGEEHFRTGAALTMVGRALVQQRRFTEARQILERALPIQRAAFGETHPRVASVLNDLGLVALREERWDEAEGHFQQVVEMYRAIYGAKHYYISIGLSNLAGLHQERGQYVRAEELFREALANYGETLPPEHQLVGIAHVRLGTVLLAQKRYREAEEESLKGYENLMKQSSPPPRWLNRARETLVEVYEQRNEGEKAERMRAEMEPG